MSETAIAAVKRGCEGLLYMSESDAPFRTFVWEGIGNSLPPEKLVELTKHKPGDMIEEVPVDRFFKKMIAQAEVQGEGAIETCEKLRELQKVLDEHLSEVKVFRIGRIQIDIYIVGKTDGGQWAGLKTAAVET
jgi:hypothetical protein